MNSRNYGPGPPGVPAEAFDVAALKARAATRVAIARTPGGCFTARRSMRPAFEQIDEPSGKACRRIGAGIDGHEIAHGAGERKAIDLPDAERCPHAIANLDQDNLVAAAAFARRVTVPAIVTHVSREIVLEIFSPHRHERDRLHLAHPAFGDQRIADDALLAKIPPQIALQAILGRIAPEKLRIDHQSALPCPAHRA